jgi:hypothetical protein
MDKEEKDFMISLDSKLSIIINLLMRKEDLSIKDKVALVDSVSLSYKDASKIIGISETHYAKEKSLLKKRDPNKIDKPEVQDDHQKT